MIFAYPHPWYFRLLALHIAWDILPYALDRVLAGEMGWREIPDYIRFTLAVEAGAIDVLVGDAVAAYHSVYVHPLGEYAPQFKTAGAACDLRDQAGDAIKGLQP